MVNQAMDSVSDMGFDSNLMWDTFRWTMLSMHFNRQLSILGLAMLLDDVFAR